MILDEDIKYAQRVFDISKVANMSTINGQLMRDHLALDMYADHFVDMMMTRLWTYVITEQLVDETQTVSLGVPATRWQAVQAGILPHMVQAS